MQRWPGVSVLICASLAAVSCAGVDPPPSSTASPVESPPAAPRPNIILISIDTLRADHTSLYGYDKPTTPFLQSLLPQSVRFDRAHSTSSWTLPAVVSLLTGLDPTTHGLDAGAISEAGEIVEQAVLAADQLLLPEMLLPAGYRGFGLTANAHLRADYGFDQGFERYECIGFGTAYDLRARLPDVVSEIHGEAPYFMWVHYFDPHAPYRAPWHLTTEFLDPDVAFDAGLTDRLRRFTVEERFLEADIADDPLVLKHTLALYDGEILTVDQQVEVLLGMLAVSSQDLIVVTSDHGEEFLDHGGIWHGHTLYDELIRVPLLIRFPGAEFGGTVVEQNVSLLDIVPTLLDYLRLAPPAHLQGRSLLPLLRAGRDEPVPVHASLAQWRSLESVTFGRWKYVRDLDDGSAALFDIAADPGETRDLAAGRPGKALELDGLLRDLVARRRSERVESARIELDDERLEELRALGYVR